jgi:hypothetical protein
VGMHCPNLIRACPSHLGSDKVAPTRRIGARHGRIKVCNRLVRRGAGRALRRAVAGPPGSITPVYLMNLPCAFIQPSFAPS